MGHGHSRPAGWSCRCDPRACVLACVCACVTSTPQGPRNVPCSGILWSFKLAPLSSGVSSPWNRKAPRGL